MITVSSVISALKSAVEQYPFVEVPTFLVTLNVRELYSNLAKLPSPRLAIVLQDSRSSFMARGLFQMTTVVDLVMQKKIAGATQTERGLGLVDEMSGLSKYLRYLPLIGGVGTCRLTRPAPIYSDKFLSDSAVFTGVLSVTVESQERERAR